MKLVKQIQLFFQEGSSDKVYEIDLCESGDKLHKVIVKISKAATLGEEPKNWPVSSFIWRSGELKLSDALGYIIKLADQSNPFYISLNQYSFSIIN